MAITHPQAVPLVIAEDAIEAYRQHGCFTIDGLWTRDELDEIKSAAADLPTARDGTFGPAIHPHRINPVFMRALCKPSIVALMEQLLGHTVSGLQTQFFFCQPGTQGFAAHQDNFYVQAPQADFASVWTAIDDVSIENGCLTLYPGTHKEPLLPVEPCPMHTVQVGQDINANRVQVVIPSQYTGVDCPMPAGRAAFFHGHTVHSSHPNVSNGSRRALLMTYLRCGSAFRPGNNAKREEVDVYRV
ncbi:MAG: phytanoyl-CoA dioxygenase family protein [Pirellulales bacterium]